jgi:hypothetical protein
MPTPQPTWKDLHQLLRDYVPRKAIILLGTVAEYLYGDRQMSWAVQELVKQYSGDTDTQYFGYQIVPEPRNHRGGYKRFARPLGTWRSNNRPSHADELVKAGIAMKEGAVDLSKTPVVSLEGRWPATPRAKCDRLMHIGSDA